MSVIRRRIKVLSFLPALAWAGLIFWGSAIPSKNLPLLFPHADILFHFGEYFILARLVWLAVKDNFPELPAVKIAILVLTACLVYAAFDEWHQFFVPGREMSFRDWLVDFSGAGFCLIRPPRS